MGRTLGFAAYRAYSRRMARPPPAPAQPRPDGELLWLHAASPMRLAALGELGQRAQNQRDDLAVLITCKSELAELQIPHKPGLFFDPLSSDHPVSVHQFLDHWHPDICLWAGPDLMPNLINQAANRSIPMTLLDIDRNDFPSRNHKWFPDLTRESLSRFETILTTGPDVAAVLHRIGLPMASITAGEPLRNGPSPDPVSETSLSQISQQLVGRPLWHAAYVQNSEFEPTLAAHRIALRLLHRLLLVVSVADDDTSDRLSNALSSVGLRYAFWQDGDDIDDNTQVLISRRQDDIGLWFRQAPLTFMASSLSIGTTGVDPLDAVALGSAILFGPHVTHHRETYSRLASVGAGLSVADAQELGNAVVQLVAPDHAAAMALEGWRFVTQGAALTDKLVELVQDRLDNIVPTHARP